MKSKFLEKAIARIKPEERALMVKSLEIISQIHEILDRKGISQKVLAENLKVSPAAISKMLSPGGNLELNTIIKLELFFGETIITTPKKWKGKMQKEEGDYKLPKNSYMGEAYKQVTYMAGESGLYVANPLVMGAN